MTDALAARDGVVIVVHYGSAEITRRCLQSLAEMGERPGSVLLVNNSDEAWSQSVPDMLTLTVIETEENLGFAGGVNVGLRAALAEQWSWCWLLNNDTVVRRDTLSTLLGALNARPSVELAGSYIVGGDGRIWFGGGRFDDRTGRAWHQHYGEELGPTLEGPPAMTDWLTGCSLLLRTAAVRERGLFDEFLFLYREELDWQLRSGRSGQALLVREPLVTHDVGQASGGGRSRVETTFLARNQMILARRYAGWRRPMWLATLVGEAVAGPAVKGHFRRAKWAWQGLWSSRQDPRLVYRRAAGLPRDPR